MLLGEHLDGLEAPSEFQLISSSRPPLVSLFVLFEKLLYNPRSKLYLVLMR